MSLSDEDRMPSTHWWPSGPFTKELADAVLAGDITKAEQLSREFNQLVIKRVDYDVLVKKLCEQSDACQWAKARETLELMELFPDLVKVDLTYYQSVIHFEQDYTVLDRIVEATAE